MRFNWRQGQSAEGPALELGLYAVEPFTRAGH